MHPLPLPANAAHAEYSDRLPASSALMNSEFQVIDLEIPAELAGQRLDSALARLLPEHSRTRIKGWIDAGQVQVGRLPCKPRDLVSAGSRIHVRMQIVPPPSAVGAGGDCAQPRARGSRRVGGGQAGGFGGSSGRRQPRTHPAKRSIGTGPGACRITSRRPDPSTRQGHERLCWSLRAQRRRRPPCRGSFWRGPCRASTSPYARGS